MSCRQMEAGLAVPFLHTLVPDSGQLAVPRPGSRILTYDQFLASVIKWPELRPTNSFILSF